MAVYAVILMLILAMASYSDATYCVCNSGLSDGVLQKNIDYACGAGADCTPIQQTGACFSPNNVKSHCDYAVNSYYQRRGQATGSCDFSATATVTASNPSSVSTCVFPASPSNAGTPISGTPTAGGTPTTGTPTSGSNGTLTPTVGGTPGTTTPGSTTPAFGLGPTGSAFPSTDNSAGMKPVALNVPFTLVSVSVVLISGFICPRI